jgi:hypothetical protein
MKCLPRRSGDGCASHHDRSPTYAPARKIGGVDAPACEVTIGG